MKPLFINTTPMLCMLAFAMMPLPLAAQSGYGEADEMIEEIIVTANKREQSLQDVSASITALTGADIARAGIIDITRLEQVVPGLRIGASGGEVRPAMRGARTNEVGVAGTGIAEQVVGIFLDGVYTPTTTGGLGAYVDVDRIEVLRGPQGTLYGRNTFAGSINVISNAPSFEALDGSIEVLTGAYGRLKYTGILNVPISDALAARFVLAEDVHDGIIENLHSSGTEDDLRERDRSYTRATFLWQPSDGFSGTMRYDSSSKLGNSTAIWGYQQTHGYYLTDATSGTGFNPVASIGYTHLYPPSGNMNDDRGPYEVYRNAQSFDEQDMTSLSLIADWSMDWGSVKLSYNQYELSGRQFYDNDYSDGGIDNVGGFGRQDDQDASSLELQLTSAPGGGLEWVAGIYFATVEADWEWLWRTDTNEDGVADAIVVPGWGNPNHDPHTTDSLAFYGQVTVPMGERTRLVGGLRQNSDDKTFTGSIPDWDDSALLWKAAVEHDISDDVMWYFSAATGYRTGGANDARTVSSGAPALYDSELVTSFEVGVKSVLMDGDMVLNAAFYSNSYGDVKAQLFALACNPPITGLMAVQCASMRGDMIVNPDHDPSNPESEAMIEVGTTTFEYYENGGDVSTMGLEAELRWAPAEDFLVIGNASWTSSEFDDNFRVGNSTLRPLLGLGNLEGRQDVNAAADEDNSFSFAGYTPALTPELTFSLSFNLTLDLESSVLRPSLSYSYVGAYYAFDINIPEVRQDAHSIIDLRVTWEFPNNMNLEAFVLNAGDEEVLTRAVVHSQTHPNGNPLNSVQVNWNNPTTWGLGLNYRF